VAPHPWPALREKRNTEGSPLFDVPARSTMFGTCPELEDDLLDALRGERMILAPTGTEPVKLTMSTASAVTTCSVTAGGPKTRLTAPGGPLFDEPDQSDRAEHASRRGNQHRRATRREGRPSFQR